MLKVEYLGKEYPVVLWKPGTPVLDASMVAMDTETTLIDFERPWILPDVVLLTVCDGERVHLVWWEHVEEYMTRWVTEHRGSLVAFHNAAFDCRVLRNDQLWFEKVASGRVVDTGLRYLLNQLRTEGDRGDYEYPALDDLSWKLFRVKLEKDDDIRLSYRRDMVLSDRHVTYACLDSVVTWLAAETLPPEASEDIQVKAMLALDEVGRVGMPIDVSRMMRLRKTQEAKMLDAGRALKGFGIDFEAGREKPAEMLRTALSVLWKGPEPVPDKVSVQKLEELLYAAVVEADPSRPPVVDRVLAVDAIAEAMETEVARDDKGRRQLSKSQLLRIAYHYAACEEGTPPAERLLKAGEEYAATAGWTMKTEGVNKAIGRMLEGIERQLGTTLPKTETGKYTTREDAISAIAEVVDHPGIQALQAYKHAEKMLTTFLDPRHVKADGRMHPRFVVMQRTGRTSCREPNVQNIPKGDDIRSIFICPKGEVLVSTDYGQLELCTLAEHCLVTHGSSMLADVINADVDCHGYLLCKLLGVLEKDFILDPGKKDDVEFVIALIDSLKAKMGDKEFKKKRTLAKAANFGFPGGLGATRFVDYARGYDVIISPEESVQVREAWLASFPEMEKHLQPTPCPTLEDEGWYWAKTLTGRIRSRCSFTSACNCPFQGLAADGGKLALFKAVMSGHTVIDFVHDELLYLVPENEHMTRNIRSVEKIMVDEMRKVVRHVQVKVESAVMRRWNKEAKTLLDDNGNYLVWEEEK